MATPKLRFPEFTTDPGWKQQRLGLVLNFQPGLPFPSSGFNADGKGLRLVRNRDLRSDESIVCFADDYREEFVVADGDVLVGMDGDFTPSVWTKGKALLNQRVGRIVPKDDNSAGFLLHCLTLTLEAIEASTARTTVKHLSHSQVEKAVVFIPSAGEQKKIAECLNTLDELIGAESQKLDALKAYKKGLMQQLFPPEGETLPRLRFPEFRDAPEWSASRTSDIAVVHQGYGFPDRYQGRQSGEFPFYKVSDISRALAGGAHLIDAAANYVDREVLSEIKAKLIPPGTTVFAKIGEALRLNRRALTIKPCLVDNNTAGVKAIQGRATDQFLFYLWSTISLDEHAGGVVPAVSKSAIEAIPITYPQIDEQTKIADLLASMDRLLAERSSRLIALRTHKQGLMQQLFPSSAEVEG